MGSTSVAESDSPSKALAVCYGYTCGPRFWVLACIKARMNSRNHGNKTIMQPIWSGCGNGVTKKHPNYFSP